MSQDVKVKPKKCILDGNECVSLLDILISFNAPVTEEHAWALCFQCAKCVKNGLLSDRTKCRVVDELHQVLIHRDGHVHSSTVFEEGGNMVRPEDAGKGINLIILQSIRCDCCLATGLQVYCPSCK